MNEACYVTEFVLLRRISVSPFLIRKEIVVSVVEKNQHLKFYSFESLEPMLVQLWVTHR